MGDEVVKRTHRNGGGILVNGPVAGVVAIGRDRLQAQIRTELIVGGGGKSIAADAVYRWYGVRIVGLCAVAGARCRSGQWRWVGIGRIVDIRAVAEGVLRAIKAEWRVADKCRARGRPERQPGRRVSDRQAVVAGERWAASSACNAGSR